ncbi:MAG: methionyl-tRNA formyltransferase, partial [Bacillota bacterium]|nr:methionyl-tRNA formyltransferase [Bacillota bacterium]
FGQKIPESLLNMPIHGCINVHSSLLPKFRGAAPINAAIAAGHEQTGVTTMYLASGWDTGDIILQREVPILQRDTAGSLHDRLMEIGAELLIETLEQIKIGKAPRIAQNHDEATYAFKLKKEDGHIDLSLPARELDYLIRGMNPWPGAYITIDKEDVKIWEALPCDEGGKVGEILDISTRGLLVGCGKGSLLLQRLQRPNSKATSGQDFANGLRLVVGDSLKSPNRA